MRLSRRQLISAPGQPAECHISSLVVHCRPERMAAAIDSVCGLPGAEVPEQDAGGKFVALLESASQGAILECISKIEAMPGVISVTLVYHQVD